MRRLTPTPALVISLIALFVALGGTSYAAITSLPAGSVGTDQLKNGAVTRAKINRSAAGLVRTVGAVGGAPGTPLYQNAWGEPDGGAEGVSFYKDAFGVVHLQGSAHNALGASATTIFTLPRGFRPRGSLWFAAYGSNGSAAYVEVAASGQVKEVPYRRTLWA
ncbi:MAG: hypothetical protein QOG85_2281 [Gaiellaceae bacterium]|jgi:hypothetical protein|nr:hypothetical protein [Gaiellaceae bacterium]